MAVPAAWGRALPAMLWPGRMDTAEGAPQGRLSPVPAAYPTPVVPLLPANHYWLSSVVCEELLHHLAPVSY